MEVHLATALEDIRSLIEVLSNDGATEEAEAVA